MKVNQVMNKNVITCHPEEAVSALLNKLKLLKISGMPVVIKGKLVGLISRTDILDFLSNEAETVTSHGEQGATRFNARTKELMVGEVITVDPSFTVEEAAKKMVEYDINMLPVVHGEKVVGILTRGDIIRALADYM
jgi:CBS domain-containing protein